MKEYKFGNVIGLLQAVDSIKEDHPGYKLAADESLSLPSSYLDLIRSGKKTTTIKFGKDALRLPQMSLPIITKETRQRVGTAYYDKVVIKARSELTEEDAKADGFASLKDFEKVLFESYGDIASEALLAIHHFREADFYPIEEVSEK